MNLENLSRESIAPYLPIKDVEWKLGWLLTFLTVAVSGGLLLYFDLDANPYTPASLLTGLFMIIPGLIGTWFLSTILVWSHVESNGNPIKWWHAFWERNVIGYEIWCMRDLYGDNTVTYEVHRRDPNKLWPNHTKTVIVAVPFRKGAACPINVTGFSRSWWRMRTSGITVDEDAIKVVVEMRDRNGNRFPIDVRHALRILVNERSSLLDDQLTESVGLIGRLVEGLIDRLDEAKSDLAAERIDRDAAVVELHQAAERINETKRFIRSAQAAAIRDWLRQRFAAHEKVRPVILPGQIDT